MSHRVAFWRRVAGATVALSVASTIPTVAKQITNLRVGNWTGGAFANDQTGAFTHCSAVVSYNSGVLMAASLTRAYGWSLGFADEQWNLAPGSQIPIALSFDGRPSWSVTGTVIAAHLVSIPMPPNSALVSDFRRSETLTAYAAGSRFVFRLTATSRLMLELARCVQSELTAEGGAPPSSLRAAPAPVAAAPAPSQADSAVAELAEMNRPGFAGGCFV